MPFLRNSILLLAAFLLLALTAPHVHAESELQLQEQEIKIGLLYNFLKYTEWPASSFTGGLITVCIFGEDPFEGQLKSIAGRTVNQRKITVRQIGDINEADGCHLLFINKDERSRWPALRDALAGKNILTVSDFPSFALSGGMIELGLRKEHVSASLNESAVQRAGLSVGERLLRLVTIVRGS